MGNEFHPGMLDLCQLGRSTKLKHTSILFPGHYLPPPDQPALPWFVVKGRSDLIAIFLIGGSGLSHGVFHLRPIDIVYLNSLLLAEPGELSTAGSRDL